VTCKEIRAGRFAFISRYHVNRRARVANIKWILGRAALLGDMVISLSPVLPSLRQQIGELVDH